jgi:hypothetical protein
MVLLTVAALAAGWIAIAVRNPNDISRDGVNDHAP